MERKHKRCCFKRSGSICMIREISSISSASTDVGIESSKAKVSGGSLLGLEPLPKSSKSSFKARPNFITSNLVYGSKEDDISTSEEKTLPKRFCWLMTSMQGLLHGSMDRKERRTLKDQRALNKKRKRKAGGVVGTDIPLEKEDVRKLIRLYCKHDNLYNPKNTYYGNKEFDEDCYNDISRSFPNFTSNDLRLYLEELRSLFEREYTIIESARRNYGEIMTPSIPFYSEFLFLVPHLTIDFDKSKTRSSCSLPPNSDSELSNNQKQSSTSILRSNADVAVSFDSQMEVEETLNRQFRNYSGSSISEVLESGPLIFVNAAPPACPPCPSTPQPNRPKQVEQKQKDSCPCQAPPESEQQKLQQEPQAKAQVKTSQAKDPPAPLLQISHPVCHQSTQPTICNQLGLRPFYSVEAQSNCFPANRVNTKSSQPNCTTSQQSTRQVAKPGQTVCPDWEAAKSQSNSLPQQQLPLESTTNGAQVQMLCDMIRTELLNAPDFIYFDAKWRIIEILREVHKRQIVHLKTTPTQQKNGQMYSPCQRQSKFAGPKVLRLRGENTNCTNGVKPSICPYCRRH